MRCHDCGARLPHDWEGSWCRACAGGEEPNPLDLLSADDLLMLPEPTWLVDGLLPDESLSVLYGARATFKSFLALDWALSIAAGVDWLGRRVERRPVVYIAAEGRAGLQRRYLAWATARGWPDVSRIRFLTDAANLLDPEQVARLWRGLLVDGDRPGLLVIDTMARTMVGGDENAAKDVGRFIAAVDALRDGAALVVHHAGKDGGAERGSSALGAAADLLVKAEREDTSERLTLKCEKLKDGAEWRPLKLKMRSENTAGSLVVVDPVRAEVVDWLTVNGQASRNDVAAALPTRRQDVLTALNRLVAEGAVEETDDGLRVVPEKPEPSGTTKPEAFGGGGSHGGPPSRREGSDGNHPAPSPKGHAGSTGNRPEPAPPDEEAAVALVKDMFNATEEPTA